MNSLIETFDCEQWARSSQVKNLRFGSQKADLTNFHFRPIIAVS